MKRKLFVIVASILCSCSLHAQYVGNVPRKSVEDASEQARKRYSQVYFQYVPQTVYSSGRSESGYTGYQIGFKHGERLISNPLYLEFGLVLRYTYYTDYADYADYAYDRDLYFGDVSLPVNLTWHFDFTHKYPIVLSPYFGLTIKGNIVAKMDGGYLGRDSVYHKRDFFDEDYMGGSDNTANRIQLGWQIGCNVRIDFFNLGIGYGKDLTDFMQGIKFSYTYITIGFDI